MKSAENSKNDGCPQDFWRAKRAEIFEAKTLKLGILKRKTLFCAQNDAEYYPCGWINCTGNNKTHEITPDF